MARTKIVVMRYVARGMGSPDAYVLFGGLSTAMLNLADARTIKVEGLAADIEELICVRLTIFGWGSRVMIKQVITLFVLVTCLLSCTKDSELPLDESGKVESSTEAISPEGADASGALGATFRLAS